VIENVVPVPTANVARAALGVLYGARRNIADSMRVRPTVGDTLCTAPVSSV